MKTAVNAIAEATYGWRRNESAASRSIASARATTRAGTCPRSRRASAWKLFASGISGRKSTVMAASGACDGDCPGRTAERGAALLRAEHRVLERRSDAPARVDPGVLEEVVRHAHEEQRRATAISASTTPLTTGASSRCSARGLDDGPRPTAAPATIAAMCGRTMPARQIPAPSGSHACAKPRRERARRAERGKAEPEDHPRFLADARRPEQKRGQEEQQAGVGLAPPSGTAIVNAR